MSLQIRLSSVCLSVVCDVGDPTHRVELFGNISAPSNRLRQFVLKFLKQVALLLQRGRAMLCDRQ